MFDIARWRARFGWLDTAMAVNERFGAIGGGPLAASIGLAGFLSLFPLLLVVIAVVGFLASGDATFATRLVSELGLEGQAAETFTESIQTAEGSRRAASVIGFVGLLLSSLGVVGALQTAVNAAWQTVGRGLVDKLVALGWLAGAGTLFLSTLATGPLLRLLPGPAVVAGSLLSIAITTAVLVWAYSFLGNQPLPWRAHLVGAAVVAVAFEVLKLVGTFYVPRVVASSSALYGSIGVVFAVLAWLMLYARFFVYGAVLNVHHWEQERGTVVVDVEVPRMDGQVPLTATRGGAIEERAVAD
ncbi:MAG: YihY/virulence factor BrkB family protein [Acidimicrobiales bacterium]